MKWLAPLLLACGLHAEQGLQEFQDRLAAYQKLRDQAHSGFHKLKPTPSPEAISRHEREFAHKIHEARGHQPQGNIFTPAAAAEFKRIIAETMNGPDAVTIRQSLARGEPVRLKELHANKQYPKGVPLQTTPPSLLLNLPKLPQGYQYRVIGSSLVLLDVEPNLIVDFVPDAIP